ncbi:MAG: LysR family transcriptional regulator, partial [Bdellovibrionaceae bacterium]|nr:LysR family transcriptional regulator [Pseudobdellovibrionaceae bacterium]
LVAEAYKIAPNCTVSILEGKGDELFRELSNHKIDLILSNYPAAFEQKKFFSRSVAKLPVSIFGSKKYQSVKKLFPQSLNGKPFVLPTVHSKLRHDLERYFRLQNIHIVPAAETQDTSLQKLLASNGIGLAPFSETGKQAEKNLIRLGRLKGVYEEVWLISAQRKLENPISAKLMNTFSLK